MAYFRVPTTDKVKGLLNRRGRLEKIIDLVSSLSSSPNQGDRYIDLSDNKVKEYDGSVWQEYVPNEGDNLYVLNRDKYYYFDGTEWKDLTEIVSQWDKSGDTLTPKDADNIEINGSFIGDGSQLTGIKKLIEEFVAQGNVTAGDVVAFVNGKARKGKTGSTNEIEGFSDKYQFSSEESDLLHCSKLNDDKFLICYDNKSIIGEVSGNTIMFGDEYQFSTASMNQEKVDCDIFNENKFVVCYYDNGGKCKIGEISGNTIAFGDEYSFTSEQVYYATVSCLDENNFIVSYSCLGTNDTRVNKGVVSGNSIAFSSYFTVLTYLSYFLESDALSSNKFILSYADGSMIGKSIIGEVSGNTIMFGDEYQFSSYGTDICVVSLNDSKFVVSYKKDVASIGNKIGIVSGNVISFGDEYVFGSSIEKNSLDRLNENKIIVSYGRQDNLNNLVIIGTVIGEVSGDVITFGSEYVLTENEDFLNGVSLVGLTDFDFILNYSIHDGFSRIGHCFRNIYNYIGISQETKNDGETTKVLIQGVSDVHSGLTVGQKYYADENGNLTTTETEDYIGIAISENKILLLDWQRPIMIYDGSNDEYIVPEKI